MFKITKKLPIPQNRPGGPAVYPLHQLKIGDSFLIPDITSSQGNARLSVRAKSMGIKLTCRNETDKKSGKLIGCRVWRVK